ncbi:MAG: BON domain-containing protein [Sphingomonadaceae bacterium]|nr:BON domain-containing protein [Sphingomonadaceae bacterium]
MKTDSQLQQDVMAELEWEPSFDHAHIGVAAKDGIVTLSGYGGTYAAKIGEEKAARRVKGVRGLAEEIEVRFATDPKTADPEIAKRIADMFDWSATIPKGKINVKVEHGWVTLSGDVGYHFHRQAARDLASRISGVKGVSNMIEVKKAPSPYDIRQSIMDAFRRSADLDASTISVAADGDKVTLSGKVHSGYERRIAERAAWAAPGVNRLEDNIMVI